MVSSGTTRTATFICLAFLFLLVEVTNHAEGARKRFRRPTTSSPGSLTSDQEVSASVNRFKVTRNRLGTKNTKNELQPTSDSTATSSTKSNDYKIVCYYTNWSQYRTKIGKFMPEDIQPELCTHIIYAFGWLKKNKLTSFESNDETKDGKIGLYDKMMTLKKANPSLKILLAIGKYFLNFQKPFYKNRVFIRSRRLKVTGSFPDYFYDDVRTSVCMCV
ncbi:GSCOCG00002685001-RA-CDS, partial [Cotesia congregata]